MHPLTCCFIFVYIFMLGVIVFLLLEWIWGGFSFRAVRFMLPLCLRTNCNA